MERLQKKEAQKAGGMSVLQMAKVVGNQAVVQMMPAETAWTYTDVCTPHFIRRHLIDGCEGTMLGVGQMNRLRTAFIAQGRPGQMMFGGYYISAVDRDDTTKIHHLETGA